ncbi:hypothetical protein BsIDN1_38020 [Bacillus safensis]|uniref:Scaffold protein Nfu/NifU N-terminal domain-containing protein n=1 Tax=Bacillus safensis TaxID=561879 RepID=A0A5S9MDJ3_BACIA|nr:hypothetical protein BsIDN1_38020 [Bacillus safensis]
MKITAIEPTPSPNTMKVILTEALAGGKSNNYKKDQKDEAPEMIKRILSIEGVKRGLSCCRFLSGLSEMQSLTGRVFYNRLEKPLDKKQKVFRKDRSQAMTHLVK